MSDTTKENRESFVVYASWYAAIKELPTEHKAEILDIIFAYNLGLELPALSPVCNMAFQFMKPVFDKNREKYLAACERNRKNGVKGGRPKKVENPPKASGFQNNPSKPEKPENGLDNGSDAEDGIKRNLKKFNFRTSLIELGVNADVASDFMEVRAKKKAANTVTAFKGIKKEIEKTEISANECIRIATERCWQSFKATWLKNISEPNTQKLSKGQVLIDSDYKSKTDF